MTNPYQPGPQFNEPAYRSAEMSMKHSGVGIASFIIALLVGLIEVVSIALATYFTAQAGGRMNSQSPEAVGTGLFLCGGLALAVVGAGLGIAGLLMRNRKRLFAILGLCINGVILLGVCGLMILGLAMKH